MITKGETYIIGEIGQNHNGSVDIAKLIVELIARPVHEDVFSLDLKPMNAVKMTRRDLKEELTTTQMNRPYVNNNSFGATYGEHRAFLELDDDAHYEVYKFAKEKGLDFVETLCAKGCLSIFKLFTPDYLKVASRDLTNLPLLAAMAETKIPIILSTGMAGKKELDDALEVITRYHNDISILHCVSQYPTHPDNLNLNTINYLKKHYGQYHIGRHMKGTDQPGSLGPDGVNRMVRDIRMVERWLGTEDLYIDKSVVGSKEKLERSIASLCEIKAGEVITEDKIHMLSPGDGFKWAEKDFVVGHKAIKDIPANEVIYQSLID